MGARKQQITRFLILFSSILLQILGKLVENDPNLDDFSRDLFNSANFDITKDNYSIQDSQVIFNLSTLSQDILKNPLSFNAISFNKEGSDDFLYYYFKTVVFQNGPTAIMSFDGFSAVGTNKSTLTIINSYSVQTYMMMFSNIKSVCIKSSIFKNVSWAITSFAQFEQIESLLLQQIQYNTSKQSQNDIFQVLNTKNVQIDNIECKNNLSPKIMSLKDVQIFKLSKLTLSQNDFKLKFQYFLSLENVYNASLYNMMISFNNIRSQDGFATLMVKGSDSVKIGKSIIKSNDANQGYSAFQITQTSEVRLITVFLSNNVHSGDWGGTMLIDTDGKQNSEITITDSTFKSNYAGTSGGAIYLLAQSITISHCKFTKNTSLFSGGALYIETVENLTINNVLFDENSAIENGGAISFQSNKYSNSFSISDTTFSNNYVQYGSGGALYSIFFNSIHILDTKFDSNKAFLGDGGAIFGRNIYMIDSQNGVFQNNIANKGGAMRMDLSSILLFRQSQFISNSANYTGGACYLLTVINVAQIQNTNFTENSAIYGGAVFAYAAQALSFENSLLEKNFAQQDGGSLFLSDDKQYLQLANVKIRYNKALGIGGAIYGKQIKYNFDQKTEISNNNALIGGGLAYTEVIRYNNPIPNYPDVDVITKENTAKIYGNDLGLIPSQFILEKVSQYDEGSQQFIPLNFTSTSKLQQQDISSYTIEQAKSSSTLVFFWKLIGNKTELIPPNPQDNDITEILNIQNNPIMDKEQSQFNFIQKQSLIQNQTITSQSYFSTTLYVVGQPDKSFLTQFSFLSGIQGSQKLINIDFIFRDCQIGEVYVQNNFRICYQCRSGTYSFSNPYNSSCDHKPDQIQESYGATWIMKPGYWRSDQYSSEILQCAYSDSCVGGSGYGNQLCDSGYQGMLCKQCTFNSDVKYTQNLFDQQCTNCADKKDWNILQISVLCIYLIIISYVVMSYLVNDQTQQKMTDTLIKMKLFIMDKRQTQRRLLVVYIKILLHFCQISICLNFFQISTMNTSSNLYVIPKYFSDTISVIIQLGTCYFLPDSGLNSYSLAFTQLFLIELLPILFFFLGFVVILIFYYYKIFDRQECYVYSRNFFWFCFCGMFSLSIIRTLVSVTACSHIGKEKRMYADINIDCDNNTTRTILIFTFVAPIFALLCAYLPLRLIQKLLNPKNGQVKKNQKQTVELNETQKQLSVNSNKDLSGNPVKFNNEDSTIQNSNKSENYIDQGINGSDNFSKSNFSEEQSNIQNPSNQNGYIKMEYDIEEQNNVDLFIDNDKNDKKVIKIALISKKQSGKLTEKTLDWMSYSYLTIGYKKEYQYWELVKFIFREMVIVIMMFFNEIASFGGSLCIVIYIGYLYFLNKFQPFSTGQLNNLEKEGTFIQAACLFSFVIIGQINGDYRFFFLADILCFFAYLLFFWYFFKIIFFIFVSVCENHSKIDQVKELFNKIIPNTYKINNFNSLKKWRLIQKNIKVILQRGLDDKLLDRQFLIHQNKNLLQRKDTNQRDSQEEIINLDK